MTFIILILSQINKIQVLSPTTKCATCRVQYFISYQFYCLVITDLFRSFQEAVIEVGHKLIPIRIPDQ